jgi:branched-chain amino acid transport system ATP-binding protein
MSEPLLAIENLNAYYGTAHVLQGVSLRMGAEPVALIGRNGMGKSTLCKAVVGLLGATGRSAGSVRLDGGELHGKPAYRIAKAGVGYVPQGRRLFTSLTVDEHLEIVGAPRSAAWTAKRVYELFPRLAERKHVSGTSLSGGEQQMLAIGRALLTNPRVLIMDEPSEGLAPTIVEGLIQTIKDLAAEGMGLLVVEQNLGVATSLAKRQLVMVAGSIATETTAEALLGDPAAQRRFLGVEPLAAEAA